MSIHNLDRPMLVLISMLNRAEQINQVMGMAAEFEYTERTRIQKACTARLAELHAQKYQLFTGEGDERGTPVDRTHLASVIGAAILKGAELKLRTAPQTIEVHLTVNHGATEPPKEGAG